MTTRLIDAGISSKHARNWTVGEALRELVQNWIDVKKEFNCGGTISWAEGFATIKDLGPGLQMKHLAFGENDKAEGSIGQFGEGMKSAFLTLVREGREVIIRTNGMIVRPTICMSETFEIDTLHYAIDPMAARHTARLHGTVIRVECSLAELNTGKSYFVELLRNRKNDTRAKSETFKWLDKGKISLPGGMIYVKGSVIGKIPNAMFSYHLVGQAAATATNRDRNAVDMAVVKPAIEKLISETSSRTVMSLVLNDMFTSQQSWEATLELRTWSQAKIWKRVWQAKYGKNWVMSSGSSSDRQAEYRGYKVLYNLNWSSKRFLESFNVSDSSRFATRVRPAKPSIGKVGVRSLTSEESANLKYAKEMVKKYYHDFGKVVLGTNLDNLAGVVGHVTTNGLYEPKTDTIYLCRSILSDRKQTLHTLLHETVHKVSGYSDETAEFERALLNVAVGMMMDLNK